jgi:hypothetical protein
MIWNIFIPSSVNINSSCLVLLPPSQNDNHILNREKSNILDFDP